MLTPPRVDEPELLDEHDAPRADMERSLRDLRRINRWLGGLGVYRRLLKQHGGAKSILDIGTGTSDSLEKTRGFRVGLDININHLLYRRQPGIRKVVGDARRLPFRNGAVDLVTSSHFFHHFSPEENAGILAESLRIARNVAVTDTQRHVLPLLFVQLLGAIRVVGRVTRLDAPASVRQGYTVSEARSIAAQVRASTAKVVQKWPFRWAMLLTK